MKLHELRAGSGAHRLAKRIGRGHGSGKVKTAGRGQKGQNSRSGAGPKPFFAGGQNPWTMQVPQKRGFSRARFRVDAQVVNLGDLDGAFHSGDVVTASELESRALIRDGSGRSPVKLLANGRLTKALAIHVHRASRAAAEAVVVAGGTVELQAPRWSRSRNVSERAGNGEQE
jgi:large subunit ribosomal protein L15